ncbi:MAG: hypothetical protein H6621_11375 [Halobacteriovoraceae bacterium]|nr:hypothetical protein [Halobacteriovoraceae bacterium]MCB9095660.1 hypothetical protein [Halobacteriovoraceae bacterium]
MKLIVSVVAIVLSLNSFAAFQITSAEFNFTDEQVAGGNFHAGSDADSMHDVMEAGKSDHLIQGDIVIQEIDHETGDSRTIKIQNARLSLHVTGNAQFRFDFELNTGMTIKNLQGKSLLTLEKEFTGRFDGARFIVGNYFLRMENEDGVRVRDWSSLLGFLGGFVSSKVTGKFHLGHESTIVSIQGKKGEKTAQYDSLQEAIENENQGVLIQ